MTGVLAGVEDAAGVDLREVEAFVGTSAGSIVCARLASGRSPRRPSGSSRDRDVPEAAEGEGRDGSVVRDALRAAGAAGWAATAPAASAALAIGTPAGAPGPAPRPRPVPGRTPRADRPPEHRQRRGARFGRPPRGRPGRPPRRPDRLHEHVERWGARFDGRLRICAVDRRSGRRVVFGAPGAPPASVADAVLASCAIPWVFAPVEIGGRDYVDGGVWSVTNLDAAPAGRDTQVLCLDTVAGLDPRSRRMAALRGWFRVAAELETQTLRRRGARVRHIAPDAAAADAMGTNLMDSGPSERVLAAGYRQGLALAGG